MAAFSTALALGGLALGAGTMVMGSMESAQGRRQAQQGYALQQQGSYIQSQAAQQQAQISRDQAANSVDFAGREFALNQSAAAQSMEFSGRARSINNNIVGYEQQIEGQRMQAMNLDARRRSLEVLRNQQRARAVALTNANAQGAARGSGLQGGYGQIAGQTGVNMLGISQNLQIGQNIFGLNNQITGQKQAYSDLQYDYGVQQAYNQTAKSQMMYDYASMNAGFQTRAADAGTLMSQGQGLVNQGSGYVSMGQGQQSYGQSLFNAGPQIFSMGVNAGNVLPSLMGGMNYGGRGYTTPASYANSAFGNGGIY
jgi:hypothetical protein